MKEKEIYPPCPVHPIPATHLPACVTLPLPYHHSKVKSENARFNSAVKSVDSDADGTISDAEAVPTPPSRVMFPKIKRSKQRDE